MRRIKKISKITGVVLLVLIGTAFAIPYILKGKILNLVKAEINQSVNAKAAFAVSPVSAVIGWH
jgi:hypothetical protein